MRRNVKKLPPHHMRYALPLCLTFVMTFLVSGISTFVALGWTDGVFLKWASSWMFAWCIAFPTMFFLLPLVRRLLGHVIHH